MMQRSSADIPDPAGYEAVGHAQPQRTSHVLNPFPLMRHQEDESKNQDDRVTRTYINRDYGIYY
jgi:hypothetical protein